MSETLHYEDTKVLERESHTTETDNSYDETIDDWFRPLYDLVVANADVIIRCPWMGGAEVPLSKSMWSHSEVTPGNVNQVILEVQQLLADQVIETDEPKEEEELAKEDEPEEEPTGMEEDGQKSNAKIEDQKAQENSKTVDAERQPKKEANEAKHLEQSSSRTEKTSMPESINVIAAEVVTSPSIGSEATTSIASTGSSEKLTATSSTSESSVQESIINKARHEFTTVAPSAKDQLNGTKPAIKEYEAKQRMPTFEIPEVDVVVIDATIEPEPTELSFFDLESAAVSYEVAELSDEKIEVVEDDFELSVLDHQMGTNSLTNFVEEDVLLLDHLEEAGMEPNELNMASEMPVLEVGEINLEAGEEASISEPRNESNPSGQMESTSPEQLVQVSFTIEEIEDFLIQLTERIKASEPETAEKVNEILDKIIEVPAKLETQTSENIIIEAETQEELEELFTELLDEMDIDYTPELVESLARLTLKWHLAIKAEKLKYAEDTDKAPQDIGTHEIIKKLLVSLNTAKQDMFHACAIGKSALQLYTFNFAI